jgi:hypothetical protein
VTAFAALLTNERVAEVGPETWGTKVRVNGTLCPAESVSGNATPLSKNSVPVILAEDKVMLDPLAKRVPV